jgi:hypothetical protein
MYYQPADGHNHFHINSAVTYELLTADGHQLGSQYPKASVGFCLGDSIRVSPTASRTPYYGRSHLPLFGAFCARGQPFASEVVMGIQPGWADSYKSWQSFQWLDVSGVPPGRYELGSQVNPDHSLVEANTTNDGPSPESSTPVTIPGFGPVDETVAVCGNRPTSFLLPVQKWESFLPGASSPGTPLYRVIASPREGQVLPRDGFAWRASPALVYRPSTAGGPSDELTYQVRSSRAEIAASTDVGTIRFDRSRNTPSACALHPPPALGARHG